MSIKNRLLLLIYSLIFVVLSVLGMLIGLGIGIGRPQHVTRWVEAIHIHPQVQWTLILGSALVLAVSLRFVLYALQREKEDPGVDRLTEIGHIRISLKTLEHLAVKAARRVKGIRDLTARVRHDGSNASIGIGLKLTVDGETPIQTLSEQLQYTVKSHVEEIAGVDVHQISVYIADTVQPDRSRVRVE